MAATKYLREAKKARNAFFVDHCRHGMVEWFLESRSGYEIVVHIPAGSMWRKLDKI